MLEVFYVANDWNDKTLSAALTWVNDGRDPLYHESDAILRMAKYLQANPADAGRLRVGSYVTE